MNCLELKSEEQSNDQEKQYNGGGDEDDDFISSSSFYPSTFSILCPTHPLKRQKVWVLPVQSGLLLPPQFHQAGHLCRNRRSHVQPPPTEQSCSFTAGLLLLTGDPSEDTKLKGAGHPLSSPLRPTHRADLPFHPSCDASGQWELPQTSKQKTIEKPQSTLTEVLLHKKKSLLVSCCLLDQGHH